MAFITFTDGRSPVTMTAAQAEELYQVRRGLARGTPKQREFAKVVKKIYFGNGRIDPPTAGLGPQPVQQHWSEIIGDNGIT